MAQDETVLSRCWYAGVVKQGKRTNNNGQILMRYILTGCVVLFAMFALVVAAISGA
jgi:uncharacterized membrane protein YcgQ (UPF0703/DUF1980 family)